MKTTYDNRHKQFPIERGEIWRSNLATVQVCDITGSLPDFMKNADMVYCDPPWNLNNLNMFYSKAGREYVNDFSSFYNFLFKHIDVISPKVCYLEIGNKHVSTFLNLLNKKYNYTQAWLIKYYDKSPCWLLRGSTKGYIDFDFTNMDDKYTPFEAIKLERPDCVADFCTGRGITAAASIKNNIRFVGTELNKEKLAVCLYKLNKMGQKWQVI